MNTTAIALLSGGLDSILSAKITLNEGIKLTGVHFTSPIFPQINTDKITSYLNIKIISIDISTDIIKIITKNITGKNLNPCIDCRLLLYCKAKELKDSLHSEFIITGEIYGQNSKTQSKKVINFLENKSGTSGMILRPLLKLNITGKKHKRQIELAKEYKIAKELITTEKCLIKIPEYKNRICNLLRIKKIDEQDLTLIKLGKHFWTPEKNWIIISRDESEAKLLQRVAKLDDYIFYFNKNIALFCGEISNNEIIRTASLLAQYSVKGNRKKVRILYSQVKNKSQMKFVIV